MRWKTSGEYKLLSKQSAFMTTDKNVTLSWSLWLSFCIITSFCQSEWTSGYAMAMVEKRMALLRCKVWT